MKKAATEAPRRTRRPRERCYSIPDGHGDFIKVRTEKKPTAAECQAFRELAEGVRAAYGSLDPDAKRLEAVKNALKCLESPE